MKIALATDDNYVLGTMVLLTSLVPDLRSISWSVDLYFLEGGHLSARSLSLLKRFCEEEGIRVSFVGVMDPAVPSKRHISSTTLCKFEVLRGVDEPTLWLDVDMVSAEGAITELIEQLNSLPQGRLLVARRPNVEAHKFNAGMFAARDSFDVEWRSKLDDSLPSFEQHIFQETFKDSIFKLTALSM
jgi:lipopolysaccharide biosynthesis glycosyltransferase